MKCGVDAVVIGDSIATHLACYSNAWNKCFKPLNFRIGLDQAKHIS